MVGKEGGRGSQSGLDFLWSVNEALMDSDGLELKILFVQRHKHKSSCVTSECFKALDICFCHTWCSVRESGHVVVNAAAVQEAVTRKPSEVSFL